MSKGLDRRASLKLMAAGAASLFVPRLSVGRADAAVTALKQSIAEAATKDAAIAEFYRNRRFKPIFVSSADARRRSALLKTLARADDHGLPVARYDADGLKAMMRAASNPRELGQVEVEAAKRFLTYADDLRSGLIDRPRSIDETIVIDVARYEPVSTLDAFSKSNPNAFMRKLAPSDPAYVRTQKEKIRLERLIRRGGWGEEVAAKALKPGQSGPAVVQLRNRLIRMGYMRKSASQSYDAKLRGGVEKFQAAHGLTTDGEAGASTLRELNRSPQERLSQVLVSLERQRWNNRPLGRKYIWVNIPDYHVDIMQDGKSTFRSRVVVGKDTEDRRTPEFSDVMEFMVINPSWYVPRSIVTKEYLPLMQRNPNAQSQLQIIGRNGRPVPRRSVNFRAYNERTFPYSMKQPPSRGNALGLVKFMFPNKHNIYLHDTPAKELFGREARAYSHGCVRVHKPFDFAYALLKAQEDDPEGFFQRHLATGKERTVNLKEPLPVHLTYYTAWVDSKGRPNYRRDIYGRDRAIFAALKAAGVSTQSA